MLVLKSLLKIKQVFIIGTNVSKTLKTTSGLNHQHINNRLQRQESEENNNRQSQLKRLLIILAYYLAHAKLLFWIFLPYETYGCETC